MTSKITTYQDIADYFIALSNDTENLITNLKLQKLVYYTQAWYLGVFGEPIFGDEFEAWVHGPVIPSLYKAYKKFSYNPINESKEGNESIFSGFSDRVQAILHDISEEYFGRTAYELEQLTHNEEPWVIAREGIPAGDSSSKIISKDSMKNYYSALVTK